MRGESPVSESVAFDLGELAEKITLGGWPGMIGENAADGLRFVSDYVSLIAEVEISKVSEKRRDPYKVKRLLQSLARNISTEASLAALSKDAEGGDGGLDDETTADYLAALKRLMAVEHLPAWNTHIRSADMLRKSPKRHFADPSLAVGALGLSVDKLTEDLNFFGLLFEFMVIRDLRVYADADGSVFHCRDSRGTEVDAIVEYADGTWGAFEIKLGIGVVKEAAASLKKFADKIDTDKVTPPAALTVITMQRLCLPQAGRRECRTDIYADCVANIYPFDYLAFAFRNAPNWNLPNNPAAVERLLPWNFNVPAA